MIFHMITLWYFIRVWIQVVVRVSMDPHICVYGCINTLQKILLLSHLFKHQSLIWTPTEYKPSQGACNGKRIRTAGGWNKKDKISYHFLKNPFFDCTEYCCVILAGRSHFKYNPTLFCNGPSFLKCLKRIQKNCIIHTSKQLPASNTKQVFLCHFLTRGFFSFP